MIIGDMEPEIVANTISNCLLIAKNKCVHGVPNMQGNKCEGYGTVYSCDAGADEPCETCKLCIACVSGYVALGEEG